MTQEVCDHKWRYCQVSGLMYCNQCITGCSIDDDLDMILDYLNEFRKRPRTQQYPWLLEDIQKKLNRAIEKSKKTQQEIKGRT